MKKILGLDLGTNSIGWAVVERNLSDTEYSLIDKGVDIFQEGVKIEKGVESSRASERTNFRSARRLIFRRKLRKIETLKVLSKNELCPAVTLAELKEWKQNNVYPSSDIFRNWLKTDELADKNPYACRYKALKDKLDLNLIENRYLLGRALYHLSQRRGFLSNRLESTKENDNSTVLSAISELSEEIHGAGCEYLGEYFYMCYRNGTKIRNKYTSRKNHYEHEFKAIAAKQELSEDLTKQLYKAIFYQRPLKSQKGTVGKCTFEPNKSRCCTSHPRFEEFRMLSFVNNIKIQTPQDKELRPLTAEEAKLIKPLFTRKSSKQFTFEDIAKKLAGKNNYAYYRSTKERPYLFNYKMSTSVSGMPVISQLVSIFGEDWEGEIIKYYTAKKQKSANEIVNDIWCVLSTFSDSENLSLWAQKNLQLDIEQADKFAEIKMPSEYAALSLKAINNILPYLRTGLLYSHAVFLANLGSVVPPHYWNNPSQHMKVVNDIVSLISNHTSEDEKIEKQIEDYLLDNYEVSYNDSDKLYHPSMIDVFEKVTPKRDSVAQLGSPRTSSVRNPMAMRTLFRLRKLVNKLLRDEVIDTDTRIHVETSRALNDSNRRIAIERYQRARENDNLKFVTEIKQQYRDATGQDINPNKTDILKYRLWKEQNMLCIYTGDKIAINEFLGANPKYDIEHTIPRSKGGEDAAWNKTLCQNRFNRDVKGAMIPSELSNHSAILERIESWKTRIDELHKQMEKTKGASSTKEIKDSKIQKRHLLSLECEYLRNKYSRFSMTTVPDGFRRNQDIDNSVIAKYSRLYLKSVFDRTYTIKGITTAEFRKMWGLQEQYAKKERVNHIHHCIDAITIACIGPKEYAEIAEYYHDSERFSKYGSSKPSISLPWPSFVQDVKRVENEILVSHYTPDNMHKQTHKKMRVRGKIQRNDNGDIKVLQGDSARGSLHKETFYGAVKINGEIRYVTRKNLSSMKDSDIDNIVDPVVKQIVKDAVAEHGSLAKAVEGTIWMNKAKGVAIKKVRCIAKMVTNPIHLKPHRDLSEYDYKHSYFVVNDGNYVLGIYEGENNKGELKRSAEIVNNMTAATLFKPSTKNNGEVLLPSRKENMLLKGVIKTGTMVIFYENNPEEIWDLPKTELVKRLYRVIKFSGDGRITFRYHQEARPDDKIKEDYKKEFGVNPPGTLTTGISKVDVHNAVPKLQLRPHCFNMLIENIDFTLTVTGEVVRI